MIHWLKRQHGKVLSEDEPMTVEDYAAAYKMQGESVLAADMLSRLNDLFYGQWLVLHVPFENINDFYEPIKEQLNWSQRSTILRHVSAQQTSSGCKGLA